MHCPSPKAFGLQETLPGENIPDEWHAVLVEQVQTLAGMLHRVVHAVAAVRSTPAQAQRERVHTIVAEAAHGLTVLAQDNITLERETAQFQAFGAGSQGFLPEAAARLRVIEQVNGVLHANLLAARHVLQRLAQHVSEP